MPERGAFQFELALKKKRKRPSLWSDPASRSRDAKGDWIDLGVLSTCSILLDDPVVNDVHCVIRLADGRFSIEDRGSATGTWVNGLEVRERRDLVHGDEVVVGVSRVGIALAGDDGQPLRTGDGRPLLRLTLEEGAFHFTPKSSALFKKRSDEERGKEEALATKDQWVYSETRFGRSRALVAANWLAGVAFAVLVPLLLWTSSGEALVDPGELSTVHAAEMAEHGHGCAMCHEPFAGPTAARCGECHRELFDPGRHALRQGAELAFADTLGECETCHREHQGQAMLQPEAREICGECHTEDALAPDKIRTRLADRNTDADARPRPPRPRALAYNEFSHASHLDPALGVRCADCHKRAEDATAGRAREFQPVLFERCMECHAKARTDALEHWPGLAALQWKVGWHGTDDPALCLQCHERLHEGALRSQTTVEAGPLAYNVQRRGHEEHLGLDGGTIRCDECHASGRVPADLVERVPFWHGLHLRALAAAEPAEQERISRTDCLACHGEVRGSSSLASLTKEAYYAGPPGARCGECHEDEHEKPLPLVLSSDQTIGSKRSRTDFPHGPHLGKVQGECFACHAFAPPDDALPFQSLPLRADADCRRCHADHDNVGGPVDPVAGGACGACHGFDEPWNVGPPEDPRAHSAFRAQPLTKDWTSGERIAADAEGVSAETRGSSFDHFSDGHRESTEGNRCIDCHAGRGGRLLEAARSVLDVPIPRESDPGCRDCHVVQRRRFHWE
jgi:predicted CXXCH cytochrome family protein